MWFDRIARVSYTSNWLILLYKITFFYEQAIFQNSNKNFDDIVKITPMLILNTLIPLMLKC